MKKLPHFYCYMLLFMISCVDPYDIPGIPADAGLLVVEGFINSNGPTNIQLSHTVAIDEKKTDLFPELHATVSVESESSSTYILHEQGEGKYSIGALAIDQTKRHRIRIKTFDQKEYVSDFMEVKRTPAIDSITWEIDYAKDGMQFYAYAHDPENAVHFYQWDIFETWHYRSYIPRNHWDVINNQAVYNPNKENIFDCYMTKQTPKIYTTSTVKLSKDVVYRFPLQFIPGNSEKLQFAYRTVVKQYALTRDARDYLQELQRNTEQLGTLFDAQPSRLFGNVRCVTNPDEPVLGYVKATSVSEVTITIADRQLPWWWNGYTLITQCEGTDPFFPGPYRTSLIKAGLLLPHDDAIGSTTNAAWSLSICVDCRILGGTNVKPDNWPLY